MKNLVRVLIFFLRAIEQMAKSFIKLGPIERVRLHARARARDFCKMVCEMEKLPWESLDQWIMWMRSMTTLRQLGGGACERAVRSTFTQVCN